jgi:hypothetical protein
MSDALLDYARQVLREARKERQKVEAARYWSWKSAQLHPQSKGESR